VATIADTSTSVRKYNFSCRNIPGDGKSQIRFKSFGNFFRPVTVKYRSSLKVQNKSTQNLILSNH
jgi:hypothetical protein